MFFEICTLLEKFHNLGNGFLVNCPKKTVSTELSYAHFYSLVSISVYFSIVL